MSAIHINWLTHYSNKEVSKQECSYPDPQKDVGAGKSWVDDLDKIIIDPIPLVQSEELKQRYGGIHQGTVNRGFNVKYTGRSITIMIT